MDIIKELQTECQQKLESLQKEIGSINSLDALEAMRVELLGKKGFVTLKMMALKDLPNESKREYGQEVNNFRDAAQNLIESKKEILGAMAENEKLILEKIDVTLPARRKTKGSIHPISQVIDEVTHIFSKLGFNVEEGPEIDNEDNNFTKLNTPPEHPARQMHDTFYIDSGTGKTDMLLRTQMSTVQIRSMLKGKPPFKFIAPGRTFRCDSDATHTPMFHQLEGLYVDKNIHMGHLKYTLVEFLKAFFKVDDLPVRFRPSFFPFTEPSVEVDIGCTRTGDTVVIGAGSDFLEILGCGMVHPNVLRNVGIDPDIYQGFAFGMGLDRLAMLKYGAPDLRAFFGHDVRWLENYSFKAFEMPSILGGN